MDQTNRFLPKRPGPARLGFCLLLILAAACGLSQASRADGISSETRTTYFAGLRRRGLYKLAESLCLARLSRDGLSPAERADLTLELSRTLAEHANTVSDPEQTELWSRARAALTEFLKKEPENPRSLLLEVQAAVLPATIGQARRWLAELQPFSDAPKQKANESLNQAVESLRGVAAKLTERLKKPAAARQGPEGELRQFELRALLANVRYQLGSAVLNLAHLQLPDSPEQISLVLEAQKVLKTVAEYPDDSDLLWLSRVASVECGRLLGDSSRTLKQIDAFEKLSPPPQIADSLLAERVRVLMAQKNFRDGAALLASREKDDTPRTGELGLVEIQLSVAEWRAANRQAGARLPADLRQQLENWSDRLRQDVGGIWSARADLLVSQLRDIEQYGPGLARLVGRAQAAFSTGNLQEAVKIYGEAAGKANADGRADLAFQFGFTRASIEIKDHRWEEAAADLQELAEQFPKDPKAAQSHLLAAYALGKSWDAQPSPARAEEYTRALNEHRSRYQSSPTVPEATWMLAEFEERNRRPDSALELYRSIPASHKRGSAARIAIARCYEMSLDNLRERREPGAALEQEAVQALQRLLGGTQAGTGAWDDDDVEIVTHLAKILLRSTPPRFDAADKTLARAGATLAARKSPAADPNGGDKPAATDVLLAQVRQLQVVSLAGQRKFQEAREMLRQASASSPAELLRILEGIVPLEADDRQDPFHDLGELQLEAALKLDEQRAGLTPAEQRRLDECLATAFIASGQSAKGLAIYESLLEKTPRDKKLLGDFARLLTRCGSQECLEKAVAVWKRLEATFPAGSPDWYPVRYELCRSLLLLKDPSEAVKLLKMTRLLYPKPESEIWQQRFAELEAQSEAASRGPAKGKKASRENQKK